jgi:pimeloyl-ACP methyl ester carboxylesterase
MRQMLLSLLYCFLLGIAGPAVPARALELEQPQQPPAQNPAQKPTDQKPVDQKPADQKPAEQKPAEQKPVSTTKFLTTKDGTKIAYDVTGSGPAIMLLHGAGQTKQDWVRTNYVKQLSAQFTVITVDLRGNGESDKPTKAEAYAIDRLSDDLLAVADAAGAKQFHVWGFAYGAIVGRYLANKSDRVRSMVYIGVPFGPAATGIFKDAITGFRARWQPVIDAEASGKLDRSTLSPGDYEALAKGGVKLAVAWQSALLEYPPVEPADMKVPTLWVVGSGDAEAMASVKAYDGKLAGTKVMLATIDGPSHSDTLNRVDLALEKEVEFTKKNSGT